MKNGFTSTELAKIRKRPQGAEWYVAIHRPKINEIFLINNPSTLSGSIVSELSVISSYGASTTLADMTGIVFDSNTVNLGEVRIRKDWTGGVLSVAESGSGLINWTKAYSIAVIDQYRPWIKHPRLDTATSQWRMDFDIPYDGQLNNWGPYVNMGPPIVSLPTSYVESSGEGSLVPRWVIDFYGNNSVSIQNIIDGGSWTFPDGQIVTSAIGTSISPVRMTFDGASPGGSYVTFAVSDNTGASHLGRRLIFLAEDISQFPRVAVSDITGGIESGGYQARLTATNLPESTYPYLDNSEIIVFERANYGSSQTSFGGNFGLRENIIFRGWVTTKDIRVSPFSSDMFITAETVGGVLADADSYDMFIANYQAGGSDWTEMQGLCLDGVAQFALKWRSTLGKITDWSPMGGLGTTEVILYQDLPRGGFFDQLKENYSSKGVLGYFSADMQSNLFAFQDININGSSATAQRVDILPGDLRDDIEISTVPRDVNSQVSLYAVTSDIPFGAESPANVRGYFGGERIFERGLLVDSQDRLITWTGNYRAKLNSKFPRTTLRMANNMRIDPVPQSVVRMSLAASDNSRGITWTDKAHLTKELNVTYDSMMGYPMYDLVVEEVVDGIGGSSITFPTIDDIVPIPTEPPPPGTIDLPEVPPVTDTFGTGFGTVYTMLSGELYRTRNFSSSSPVWVGIHTGNLYDFILDPWNPDNNSVLLRDDGVWLSTEMANVSPGFTQVLDATDVAAVVTSAIGAGYSNLYWRIVKGSINVQGYFVVGFSVRSSAGNTEWFCAYTYDYGQTWGSSYIGGVGSANYNQQYNALDVVPHLINGNIRLFSSGSTAISISNDGGATWSVASTFSVSGANALDNVTVHCPYEGNEDGNIVYLCHVDNRASTYVRQLARYSYNNGLSPVYNIIYNGGGNGYTSRWAIESYTNNNLYIYMLIGKSGLYVSNDGGATYSAATMNGIAFGGTGTMYSTGGFPTTDQQFYAVTGAGVYVSTDRGENWTDKTGTGLTSFVPLESRTVIVPLWTE
jgi:hypothetical protein